MRTNELKDRLAINMHGLLSRYLSSASSKSIEIHEAGRVHLEFDGAVLPATLLNLPTISEIHKTTDTDSKFNFYKCGDLSQMVLVEDPDLPPEQRKTAECSQLPLGISLLTDDTSH
jgi:TATA-binding protein-associated factor Taf7